MKLPINLRSIFPNTDELLKESLELEHRRRQLTLDVSRLRSKIAGRKPAPEYHLIADWLNALLDDLTQR